MTVHPVVVCPLVVAELVSPVSVLFYLVAELVYLVAELVYLVAEEVCLVVLLVHPVDVDMEQQKPVG